MTTLGRYQTDPKIAPARTSPRKARLKVSENEAVSPRTQTRPAQIKASRCGNLSKLPLLPFLKFRSPSRLSAFSIRRRNRTPFETGIRTWDWTQMHVHSTQTSSRPKRFRSNLTRLWSLLSTKSFLKLWQVISQRSSQTKISEVALDRAVSKIDKEKMAMLPKITTEGKSPKLKTKLWSCRSTYSRSSNP